MCVCVALKPSDVNSCLPLSIPKVVQIQTKKDLDRDQNLKGVWGYLCCGTVEDDARKRFGEFWRAWPHFNAFSMSNSEEGIVTWMHLHSGNQHRSIRLCKHIADICTEFATYFPGMVYEAQWIHRRPGTCSSAPAACCALFCASHFFPTAPQQGGNPFLWSKGGTAWQSCHDHVVSILLPSDAVWFSGRGPPMPDNPPTCFRGPHLQASLLWAPKFVESSDVRWCKPMAHASAQHWSNARYPWRRHFLRSIETFHQRQESATKTSIVTSGMMWEVELGLWQWGQKRSEPIFTIFIYIQDSLRWMAWVSARGNFSCTSWARMEALGACVIATLTCLLGSGMWMLKAWPVFPSFSKRRHLKGQQLFPTWSRDVWHSHVSRGCDSCSAFACNCLWHARQTASPGHYPQRSSSATYMRNGVTMRDLCLQWCLQIWLAASLPWLRICSLFMKCCGEPNTGLLATVWGWDPAGFAVISFGLHRFCLDCCDCLFDLFAYPGHPNRGSALAESNTRARRNLLPGLFWVFSSNEALGNGLQFSWTEILETNPKSPWGSDWSMPDSERHPRDLTFSDVSSLKRSLKPCSP